ncbi:glycoside hydrolase [Rozella allomycis CSF55]|uniref:Glycoside hydrolase n=1 Tax=Rozella allomycis (strain CSF55) TaxID=988480 RepID=A0A075AVN5_ROZAC|nr:Glycoside hydrolase, family 5 domain-containing protein [Rozella allomycis CSF55]RKP20767.1 glycoside hydrolase [Rozella allomycis CSF55]|eukprot:EPZ34200.1 Glycoside hydrolase, family 5 domain-containing protein [Rozella allomycis CSF55]
MANLKLSFIYLLQCIQIISSILPPLKIKGNQILDSRSEIVHLHCVNWAGAHQRDFVTSGLNLQNRSFIADQILDMGFNCVRLQYSAQMVVENPVIPQIFLEENKDLINKRALHIYQEIVATLTQKNIMVILDMHMMDADWCCNWDDQNGLWFNERWSKKTVIDIWVFMADLFKDNQWVIGADLRNELRISYPFGKISLFPTFPSWGRSISPWKYDWANFAETLGNAVVKANRNLLIIVQGPFEVKLTKFSYPQTLEKIPGRPLELDVPNRVVYSCHDYSWFHREFNFQEMKDTDENYEKIKKNFQIRWGNLSKQYPVWLGEFGTVHSFQGVENNTYWKFLTRYINETKVHWAYWPLDGTQASGRGREFGTEETFGLLNTRWDGPAYSGLIDSLKNIMF